MAPTFRAIAIIVSLCMAVPLAAQDDDVSLGDLARAVRKSKAPEDQKVEDKKVIDNDNFSVMMDKAESARLNGKPVFSIDPVSRTFTMTSTDGSCSLSFDAKASSLGSTPYIASDLPQDELSKLEGPARISDDVIEVSVHNRTSWELKEIVVGITVLQLPRGAEIRDAALSMSDPGVPARLPDSTVLYHLKGTAAPDSTTVFRGSIGGALMENDFTSTSGIKSSSGSNFNSEDWHWAIVAARGIPPAPPVVVNQKVQPSSASPVSAGGVGLSGVPARLGEQTLNSTNAPAASSAK